MTHAGPLPGLTTAPRPMGFAGAFSGYVERLDPLGVSVAALSGQGQVRPNTEQVPGLDLAVGDPVWVICVNGDSRNLLVFALRAPIGHTTTTVTAVVAADGVKT